MPAEPLVSVIMPTRNHSAYLETAIGSLQAQTYANWELVVVDDCSTDDTPSVLDRLGQADARIRAYRNETNLRQTRTRNFAIGEALGTYIAQLDSDDEREPTSLEQQVAFLEANPDVVAVGTGCQWCDEELNRLNDRLYPLTDSEIRRTFMRYSPFCLSSVVMRASVLEQPVFDPAMEPAEDIDLAMRLGMKGKLANLPGTLYRIRTHPHSVTQVDIRPMEKQTFRIRRKAVREYGYRASLGDLVWNAAQYATMYVMPGSWRVRLFNRMRATR
jgi:glycosyltransferase involved in cell wall biosynthesis